MSGAEFDSSIRNPPPRCHPGTRIAILGIIRQWLLDPEPVSRLFWLFGAMGVGKSAIVQTLAEELWTTPRLGATLFFSRPNHCDKPAHVFATLAYQLAVRIPAYREFLRRKMTDDPKLLDKSMEYQFNILIAEPFSSSGLTAQGGGWVILLDGLDECEGSDAQIIIIKLISRFSQQHPSNPLRWLIASRPEAHIIRTFKSAEIKGTFLEQDVPANSDAACQDVEKYLRAQFIELQSKYEDLIPRGVPWPAERDVAQIASMASGYFIFATTAIRFIDDPSVGNPVLQLPFILSVSHHTHRDPFSPLHALYSSILDTVPKYALPTLKLLLGFELQNPRYVLEGDEEDDPSPLAFKATILNLQQDTLYAALPKLYSVIRVPPFEESGLQGIRFYHASFADYLCDASKAGEYAINPRDLFDSLWRRSFALIQDYPRRCSFLLGNQSHILNQVLAQVTAPFPRVKLSWDVKSQFTSRWPNTIWLTALMSTIHYLTPFCSGSHGRLGHCQVHLSASEFRNTFEKVDFSQLAPRRYQSTIVSLYGFYRWLMHDVSLVINVLSFTDCVLCNRYPLFLLKLVSLNRFPFKTLT